MAHLTIDSQKHAYVLDEKRFSELQSGTNSTKLEPGTYVVRINKGSFSYGGDQKEYPAEPFVLIWIYGGKFINKKTNVEVGATWSTLNGPDDTLTLEVKETTTLSGLFFDTYERDNTGEITLSILKDA
jgi:hypothetical protein